MEKTNIYFRHNQFRKEQDIIIKDILTNLYNKKHTLLHAPTGTGKTDASLAAAITYVYKNNKKILFLTPKISQHKIALEVIKDINTKYNLNLKAIDFVGKRNMCIDPGISEMVSGFYEVCKKAIEKKQCPFYLNIKPKTKSEKELVNIAIERELKKENVLSHIEIKKMAKEFKSISKKPLPLCAYELAKIHAKSCDVIIADYYHLFSKNIADSLLAEMNIDLSECIVIVDEAHNLEDRLLKLLSKSLNTNVLNRAIKEAGDLKLKNITNFLKDLEKTIENLIEIKLKERGSLYSKQKYKNEEIIKKEDIIDSKYEKQIFEIIKELEDAGIKYIKEKDTHRSAMIAVALFLDYWINDFQSHIRFITFKNNIISIKYNALDISIITKDVFDRIYASIIMSATLTPLSMYKEIFGLPNNTITKEYQSPFKKENRLDLLINDVTTKYTNRNNKEYEKIAKYINKIVNSVPGNIIVFFPSFEILREIEKFIEVNKTKIIQEENSDSDNFNEMIDKFKKSARYFGAVLFAVMGGKVSEGIDLPGDYLISAVIVGIPLSRMELETKAKIEYYDKKYNKGWQYAYIQPAIQKAIQSAGRVIRTEKDRGVVVFLDGRYEWSNYKAYLPKNLKFIKTKEPHKEISNFFK